MRSLNFQPSFLTPSGEVGRVNGLDDIRNVPHFAQRSVPQSNAEQDWSSALRICVHLRIPLLTVSEKTRPQVTLCVDGCISGRAVK